MGSNILSVFERVATVTNEKIARILDDVGSFPENLPNVPGIDLTAGGEHLTYSEAVLIKRRQEELVKQLLALQVSFASVNCLVMNKKVFYEIAKELKLYRIYEPSQVGRGGSYRLTCDEQTVVFLKHLEGVDLREEVSSEIKKRVLFPNYEVHQRGHAGTSFVEFNIVVTPPPEHIRKKIVEVLSAVTTNLTKDKSIELCTLADEKAFQVDIIRFGQNNVPGQPNPLDPGIVLERGDFAVILTDTFYHVSDIEQQFLERAEQVAENWSVKQFLLN